MVVLNRIYTKTGDKGETGLGDGTRVAKHALRIAVIGAVDETNAAVGVARLFAKAPALAPVDAALNRIQNDLFDLGADLCVPETDSNVEKKERPVLRISASQVERLEREIDAMNAELAPLRSFVLPGGEPAAAHLHVARVTARRAERLMVALAQTETLGEPALHYINRLSDHLFVAARFLNSKGIGDVLWTPGKTGKLQKPRARLDGIQFPFVRL